MYDIILLSDTASTHELARGCGVYRLATEIRQHGFSVIVIDYASVMSIAEFEEIISKVHSDQTKIVGISSTWFPHSAFDFIKEEWTDEIITAKTHPGTGKAHTDWHVNSIAQLIARGKIDEFRNILNKYGSEYKLIMGGAKSYQFMESNIDHIFVGHAENTMIEFLKGDWISYPRIIDWDTKAKDGDFDFNSSVIEYVDTDVVTEHEVMGLETSRGCIFSCKFCNYPHKGQNTRDFMKYEETLYNELMDNYTKWGITRYTIIDDTFNDYTDKLIRIKNVVDRLPFQPIFWAYIRFDIIARHPEQAQLLYDIGVRSAMHGLETWNPDTAKAIRKGKIEHKVEGMKISKELWGDEVFVCTFYVVGLPKDNAQDAMDYALWWKTEGHQYVDNVVCFPFYLRDLGNYKKYAVESEIEAYKEMYGYTMTSYNTWDRNDGGDITSFEIASKVAKQVNEYCMWQKPNKNWSWHPYADDLGIEDRVKATKKFFDEIYLPRLKNAISGLRKNS